MSFLKAGWRSCMDRKTLLRAAYRLRDSENAKFVIPWLVPAVSRKATKNSSCFRILTGSRE